VIWAAEITAFAAACINGFAVRFLSQSNAMENNEWTRIHTNQWNGVFTHKLQEGLRKE
jgi:hypothetical protein